MKKFICLKSNQLLSGTQQKKYNAPCEFELKCSTFIANTQRKSKKITNGIATKNRKHICTDCSKRAGTHMKLQMKKQIK